MQQQFSGTDCIQPDCAAAVHTCDICGANFGDSSLRAHKAKLHSRDVRQQHQPSIGSVTGSTVCPPFYVRAQVSEVG